MTSPDAALATQVRNIEAKTGKSLAELHAFLEASGLSRHGEKRAHLMQALGLGYGDANTVVRLATETMADARGSDDDPLAALYTGPKAHLRPLHERLIAAIDTFGTYEIAPKKNYVSLRRRKQFATLGPATRDSIEIGLNAKALVDPHARLKVVPPGGMCQYSLRLSAEEQIDQDLLDWLRTAYTSAA